MVLYILHNKFKTNKYFSYIGGNKIKLNKSPYFWYYYIFVLFVYEAIAGISTDFFPPIAASNSRPSDCRPHHHLCQE